MLVEIKIPKMGESVIEGTVASLLKPSGSQVKEGDEIIEIETDKVNQVLYAPATGLLKFSVKQGDTVKVGQSIGTVDTEGKGTDAPSQPKSAPQAPPTAKKETTDASPPIRQKVDDVLAEKPPIKVPTEAPKPPRVSGRETRQKMSKLRKVIAQKLVEVKNQTAMLTTFNEIDMSGVIEVREREKENFEKKHGVRLGFMSFFVKAAVSALQQFPNINGRIEGDEIVLNHYYDIAVAVSTDKGLMVPVIRNADQLSYAEIEKAIKSLADKARSGAISVDELSGGTFTITNAGLFGSLYSTPILNPPQSGILGMHNIQKRPVAIDDEIVIRPMMYIALSYDHRIVDGREGVLFLMHIKKNLEEPARLLLDL